MKTEEEKARDVQTDKLIDAIIDRVGKTPPYEIKPHDLGPQLLVELAPTLKADSGLFDHVLGRGLAALIVERCNSPRSYANASRA